LEDYIDCFKELENYYEDENYIYVHGGVKPGVNRDKQEEEDLLWIG
jgi:serine/threonine protein phosphatase 1